MSAWFWQCFSEEDGATAVEYAVMLALILAVAIVAISVFGNRTSQYWKRNDEEVAKAVSHVK